MPIQYQNIQYLPKPNKTMTKFYQKKQNLFKKKYNEDKTRDYRLGIDGRLQEVFRTKNSNSKTFSLPTFLDVYNLNIHWVKTG